MILTMITSSVIGQIGQYVLYILLPLFAFYIGYLIVTKAFNYLGFTSIEAIIIVFVSFILGSGIVSTVFGVNIANIYLFTHGNWDLYINTGGAIIPILLSVYLIIKKKLPVSRVGIGILLVAIVTFLVTYVDPEKGIASQFPFWLLPVLCASFVSIVLCRKNFRTAAPLSYVSGVIGVLIGADCFHLVELLNVDIATKTTAVIGGANVFDMVFLTGILAVVIDGILMYQQQKKELEK